MSDEEDHFLSPYLSKRLPELGLDYETYGPYCLGTVGSESSNGSGDDEDYEELDGILELLQSSSETHSDDEAAWTDLRAEIIRLTAESRNAANVKKSEEVRKVREAEEEKIRQARAEAEAYEKILEEKKAHMDTAEDTEKKKARDALLNRFAYEKEDDGAGDGGKKDVDDGPVSNKDVAAQAQREHVQKVRDESSKGQESKVEARQKNKEAMKLKADKKEERRKKATKGERKR
uniref:Coiled-coil domain-containing protein 43 n=1 Tax=Minutocellus polymorphus TaxID=265543 RepID=A0A7S0AR62_9STRA|mmetsp:Transcript_18573/g.30815  ORF Transcript_18573/g.30815 Transcript_18573/m.30815 type:complete len:233 (+) Transcript_18573:39-737(+)